MNLMRICLAVFLLLLSMTASAQLEKGLQEGWVLDDEDKVLLTARVAQQMKDAGAQWVRVNFRLTPKHPKWDAGLMVRYREVVNNIRSSQMKVLGVLGPDAATATQSDWIEHSAE